MADAQLVKYIQSQLKTGYSVGQIRTELLKTGYTSSVINAALKESRQEKFPHILLWAGIVTIVLIIIILSSILYVKMQAQEELPVAPTEEIKEEIIIEEMPETKPEMPEILPEEKIIPEDIKDKVEFKSTEEIEKAREASFTDADRASRMCTDLLLKTERDVCFYTIAKSAEKSNLCGKISPGITRDQCYFSFAVLGEDTCAQISDEQVQRNCEQLIGLNLPLP